MQEKFYQACYTRVGVNEGWKTIHYSPDIPQPLLVMYEKTEAGNEVKRGTPLDIKGNALWMLEILCNKEYVGISRTQYGLSDAFGRSNFFSHGYLFPDAYELLKDPNSLLEIKDENFKNNIEETGEIPAELLREKPYNISSALESCHMTKENYILFIKCVYYALCTNTNNTIYIRTDGEDETMKKLLYLIYMAIPYSMRIKITASSCTDLDGTNKMLIFGVNIPEYSHYFDPYTGENNIMTPAIEKRWSRNPFVVYFAKNIEAEEENEQLYRAMEKWLGKMGDVTMNNMDAIRLAYTMCNEDLDSEQDNEVIGLLYDWLSLPVPNSEAYEHQVTILLDEIIKRKIKLGEEIEQLLMERVNCLISEEFKNCYLEYLAFVSTQIPKEEGCRYLKNLGKENPVFVRLRAILTNSKEGRKLLCEFYKQNVNELMVASECTYGDIVEAYYDCEDLKEIEPEVQNLLHKKNIEIAKTEIDSGVDFETVKLQYKNTELDIHRSGKISKEICEEYDNYIKNNFDVKNIEKYKDFYTHWMRAIPFSDEMIAYLDCMYAVGVEDYSAVRRYIESDISYDIDSNLLIKLYKYIINNNTAEKCTSIAFWRSLSNRMGMPLVKMLAENHAVVLYNPEILDQSLKSDLYFWRSTEQIDDFYKECVDYVDCTKDKSLNPSCELLKCELKKRRAEEKKRRREQSKKEKSAEINEAGGIQPILNAAKSRLFGRKK